jgi:hypothetical protein
MRKAIVSLLYLSLVIGLAAILTGCSEKAKNPVGFGLVDDEGHWQVQQAVFEEVLADSCLLVSTGAGRGHHLLVGSWNGQEARSLVLFEELPDTLAWPLTGATLLLTSYSEASEDSLTISLHAVETEWADSTVTWELPWTAAGGDYAAESIARGDYAASAGSQLELEFDSTGVELVAGWLQGEQNNGIIITAVEPESENLKYFYTEDTPYDPILTLTFATGDTTDTTFYTTSTRDAFIAQPQDPPPDDVLCVADGIVRRTWLQFDISALPESVFVNRAVLSLTVTDFLSPLDNTTVGAYQITDPVTLEYSAVLYGSANLFSGKDVLEIDMSPLVQKWAYGTSNDGILLKNPSEYRDISSVYFSPPSAGIAERPTLTVTYTRRPEEHASSEPRLRGTK